MRPVTGAALLVLVLVVVIVAALGYIVVIAPVLGRLDLVGGLYR